MTGTPKPLPRHFLLCMLLLFGLFVVSCENDESLVEEKASLPNHDLPISIVTTTYEEAGEKFKQLSSLYELESHKRLSSFGGIEKSGSTGGIVIISEVVKEIKRGDYTSYTMLIEPKDISGNIFYNLTIEDVKGVTKMFITKYVPTEAWLEDNNMPFHGQITTFRIDNLQTPLDRVDTPINGGGGGGSNLYPTDCNGTVVATVIVDEIPCGCPERHRMGENCSCPYGHAYYDYKTVYECIPNSPPPGGNPFTDPPGGTPGTTNPPGGGPGGGSAPGNTPPSPAGNDPSLTAPVGPKDGAAGSSGPCGVLKNLLQNIKPSVESLITTLNQPGENGITFEKNSNGVTQNNIIPNSYGRMLVFKPTTNTYGYIHTHPFNTYPMFSWGDIFTLSYIYQNSLPQNKDNVTIMIIAKADDGITNLVYALTISNPQLFIGLINQSLEHEELIGCNSFEKNRFLSTPLDERFFNSSTGNEQDFLRTFYGQGIDLWKADPSLTSWTKLSLSPINMSLTQTPCN